ncbi:MAG: HEAT repeat domain-containing protein, partial [Planctomycetaceae bacterium]|nr:HEAT repeat domain-containing protein [Planctomycetaceae bacterium]
MRRIFYFNETKVNFVVMMLVTIFLIVVDNGCRARGRVGQHDVGSVISNSPTNNLAKNNSRKNNSREDNLSSSVDNRSWWPGEIPVPSEAISNSTVVPQTQAIAKSEHTKTNLRNENNFASNNKLNSHLETHEVIIPPRPLEPFSAEPKPLAESNNKINQVNNSTSENNKNIQPADLDSNKPNNSNTIKTAAADKSARNEQDVADGSTGMSLNEFETILLNAKWQRNIQLDHWLDNGTKSHDNKLKNQSRDRREQIKQLNLSDKDKLKKNPNQVYVDDLISTWRWYSSDIDELVTKQLDPVAESRPIFPVDPKEFLENSLYKKVKYNTLRANAAILMGRCNDYDSVDALIDVVKNERSDEIRCAAIETLGKMEHVEFEKLIPLLEFARKRNNVTKNTSDNNRNDNDSNNENNSNLSNRRNQITVVNKVIWSELLTAIADKIEPWEHPCFLDSLAADNVDVRRTSAKLWRLHSQPFWNKKQNDPNYRNDKDQTTQLYRLPMRFLVFARSENDLAARIEIIKTLGIWREPEIFDIVKGDLNHTNM